MASSPLSLTDDTLESLLTGLESDRVERKESFKGDAPRTVREAVCAFANDLPGRGEPGVVFVGATDDGRPAGLPITDELLRALSDIKTDGNILPPPTLVVQRRRLLGSEVAVVLVAPADSPPVRYAGRIHVRVGPRRATASAQDERILSERRRFRDRPFDAREIDHAAAGDLSQRLFEELYLPNAFAADVLAANERTVAERLAATKMVSDAARQIPTVLGMLVLGRDPTRFIPGAYVQFLRVAGADLADPVVDALRIEGPLPDLMRRLEDKLVAHNRVAVDFTSSSAERRTSTYPLAALQQLTTNAILHRAYEGTNAPVRVTWYDDRVEIVSPGGPYGAVTPENFGDPGLADYRNPNLADAMRVLGFVQRFGAGLPTARRALEQNGSPPMELEPHSSYVTVRLRPPREVPETRVDTI